MTYLRVIPRDLFNEASLLKCLGQLCIQLDFQGHKAVLDEGDGSAFDVQQDPSDGSLSVANLRFTIGGRVYRLTRPLNSRRPWPLYATDESDDTVPVFDNDGMFSDEFEALIHA